MINYTELNAEYDSIIIFDMLSDEEREREKDKISEGLESFIKGNKYSVILLNLESKDELLNELKGLLDEVKQGETNLL